MIRPIRDRDPTPPDPGPAIEAAIDRIVEDVEHDTQAGSVEVPTVVELDVEEVALALAHLNLYDLDVFQGVDRIFVAWEPHDPGCPTRIDHALMCRCYATSDGAT